MSNAHDDFQHLFERAQQAARDRDAERACVLLRAAVALAPGPAQEKRAWLTLAQLETTPQAKAAAYRRVLELDPRDRVARAYFQGLRDARPAPAEKRPRRLWPLLLLLPLLTLILPLLSLGLMTPSGSLPTSAPSLTPSQTAAEAPVQAQAQALPPQASLARNLNSSASPATIQASSALSMTATASTLSATLALFVLPSDTPMNGGSLLMSSPVPPLLTNPLFIPPTAPPAPTSPLLILPTALASATPTTASLVLPSATPTHDDFVPLPTSTTIPALILPTAILPPTEVPQLVPAPPDFPLDLLSGGGSSRP
ncbi:MAG: hypothetical protein NZ750_07270 [Anaerolineae bacterium]|nr:hypothetical protein [Anaerolineae bacterium]MDW8170912.1 hypothetical protein [Anaerolineae bacterium]